MFAGQEARAAALPEQAGLAWLAADERAHLVVDRRQALLWANAAAGLLLAGKEGIEIRGGALSAADPSRQEELRALFSNDESGASTLCFGRPGSRGWLLIRCLRLDLPGERLFALTLIVADEDFRAQYAHLDTAFGLTKAEHRVLLDLLAGNDAESLAALHGVSIETTRTHIRNIYGKMDVGSREALFARVQAFRL